MRLLLWLACVVIALVFGGQVSPAHACEGRASMQMATPMPNMIARRHIAVETAKVRDPCACPSGQRGSCCADCNFAMAPRLTAAIMPRVWPSVFGPGAHAVRRSWLAPAEIEPPRVCA